MARKYWVALHRYLGLAMLMLWLVISVTGSLLVFRHEIDAWLNPALLRVEHGLPPLSPETLATHIEQSDPRLRVSLMPLSAPEGSSYEVRVEPRIEPASKRPYVLGFDRIYVDPSTGRILGQRQWGALQPDRLHLMPFLEVLHRRLQLPGKWGLWLTGSVAITWLLTSLLGAWLTLPRVSAWHHGFWEKWKPAWSIKRGASTARRTFDLHRSLGLWSLPFALVLAVSGVYFNLADEVFKPVLNWFSTVHQHPVRSLPLTANSDRAPAFGIDEATALARRHLPAALDHYQPWYANHLRKQGVYRIAFKEPDLFEQAFSLRYEQIFIDDQTGTLRARYGYHQANRGERFIIWQYPLHTGRVLGLWGRLAILLAGIAGSVLAIAGVLVWNHRRRARRAASAPRRRPTVAT